ncbi:hypothetical protein Megpolyxen_01393 [Candidatus Megaera polyxenophila]|nr:hypothetical protein Megpolyxen_01393 [Candidatus Megaera polyxenophila]
MSNIAVKTTLLTPSNLKEAMEYATIIANSAMVPKTYQGKAGDILVAVQMGAELGLKPIQALQNIAVINGKPSVYGDALLALVQAHSSFEDIKEWYDDKTNTAFCTVKRKNQTEHTVSFSIEDAKKAGLWGKSGPWTQYPKRMMQMRARGFALRDKFADALGGLITVEEAQDYQVVDTPEKNVTPITKTDMLSNKLDSIVLEEEVVNQEPSETLLELLELVKLHNVSSQIINKWCSKAGVESIVDLDTEKQLSCIEWINKQYNYAQDMEAA